jgi:hypothetical protein
MIGGESFTSIFRQVFRLSMIEKLNYTKGDIEEMPPFERYAYFDLINEYNDEIKKQREQEEQEEQARNMMR